MTETQKKKCKRAWGKECTKMDKCAAVVACRVGSGAVILISPHPELSEGPGMECALPQIAAAAINWVAGLSV